MGIKKQADSHRSVFLMIPMEQEFQGRSAEARFADAGQIPSKRARQTKRRGFIGCRKQLPAVPDTGSPPIATHTMCIVKQQKNKRTFKNVKFSKMR